MKLKSKMVRFLLSTVVVASMLCACTEDVTKPNVNDEVVSVERKRLPQVRPDYGELHNSLLDECLVACQGIDVNPYTVKNAEDAHFYDLYAAYANEISQVARGYLTTAGGDASIIPGNNNVNAITTPQNFWTYSEEQREFIAQNFYAGDSALNQIESLLDSYLELVNDEVDLEYDPYWQELAGHIEDYAEEIYLDCEPLCATDDERESLEIMLSVMVGSFNYWTDADRMAAWRDLEWNAKCKYLNLNELPEIELEEQHIDNEKSTKEKVCEFVREDINGAASGAALGALFAGVGAINGAIAIGSICSGLTALSWD